MPDDPAATGVTDATTLRELVGPRKPVAVKKQMARLDGHCRRFIGLSPFLCIGTMGPDGRADVSPRGDPPGFVKVLDDRTIVIPDRPGNRRVDSMTNLLTNAAVGIIFFVPGVDETLRVNGRASLLRDPEVLAGMAVEGREPGLGIQVEIDEVFFHCGKALKRARLWDPARHIERTRFPSMGRLLHEQTESDLSPEAMERSIEDGYRNELY
ncbi:MAG TPA: pyridoxamine 5'-phosphate oxidase family protein [Candidatus Sulfotelmatobacter sp.]|nr:pyridoxamine 5'-phosphate oxidase family protein [Candidatus Sulfotelmatobacter sp.]